MFTGIIEAMAEVKDRTDTQLRVGRPQLFVDIAIGSSISVSGTCLSVVDFGETSMAFDVIPETYKCTKLSSLDVGDKVNLERAMKASDRFEGHLVQGHVESVGVVIDTSIHRSLPPWNTSIPRPLPPRFTSIPRPLPPPAFAFGLRRGKREEGENKENDYLEKEKWEKDPVPPNIRFYAREMRKDPTEAESLLWNHIRYDQLGVRFRRQYYMNGCIFDFYCPAINLAIELDGNIHKERVQKRNDQERDDHFLQERHITTLRFGNDNVINNTANVLKTISKHIQQSSPPPVEEGSGVEAIIEEGLYPVGYLRGVEEKKRGKEDRSEVTITVPNSLLKFITPKGSISLDGVSLTVASVEGNRVTVALIPHTIENTTLGFLKDGDTINIETDVMVRSLLSK
ncbi:DUF559 domain-containing protein [Patescibacteria group bacterium]|nr:DUF559 domain-containing protein [Patescibacteria group bacterium]MBU2259666.1 DUF559 domain-containing protein [Patescibacteria group bacterium]